MQWTFSQHISIWLHIVTFSQRYRRKKRKLRICKQHKSKLQKHSAIRTQNTSFVHILTLSTSKKMKEKPVIICHDGNYGTRGAIQKFQKLAEGQVKGETMRPRNGRHGNCYRSITKTKSDNTREIHTTNKFKNNKRVKMNCG